jgi:hypothetical protein
MARRQQNLYTVNPINVNAAPEAPVNLPDRGNTYEAKLNSDPRWALMEGSRHFDERSAIFDTLRDIALRLNQLDIPYAIVGGMALFRHGFRRFTEDVDILVSKDDLKRIHAELDGRGYVPPHRFSKNLRDTVHNVKIEFLLSGEFPGDGKPKPVAFPNPQDVNFLDDGIRYLNLSNLIELKLASGMTQPDRIKDLGDVQQLIQILNLSAEFSGQLNPYVRDKFMEMWQSGKKRYVAAMRNRRTASGAASIEDAEKAQQDAANMLEEMRRDGVEVSSARSVPDDYTYLVTTDPLIAAKYDMVEESEYWPEYNDPESTP